MIKCYNKCYGIIRVSCDLKIMTTITACVRQNVKHVQLITVKNINISE